MAKSLLEGYSIVADRALRSSLGAAGAYDIRYSLADAVVEKDFWARRVLKQLFSIEIFSDRSLFEGRTSLSKISHAITRFSEDIDIAVD